MSTIYEIAKKAGVSPTTVSKVINNYPDVSEKTRSKIKKILDDENFYPNSQAQTLITKKTWTLGIVYYEDLGFGLNHPFFGGVIESFKKQADKYGYSLLFGSKNNRLRNNTFLEYFKHKNVDGIAIICADDHDKEMIEMVKSDFPTVIVDRNIKSTASVGSNHFQGAMMAMNHLYELGHIKIAHIPGTDDGYNWPSDERKRAYEKAMNEFGLDIEKGYIATCGHYDVNGGYNSMKELLSLKTRPTAVFVASDKKAIGAIDAIKDAGLRVPEDISIIGFDDIELAQYLTPKLTTIKQDAELIGKKAIDLLVKQIDAKTKINENKLIPVELIVRDSCKKIK